MRKSHGRYRKSRHKLRRWRSTPPVTVSRYLQRFEKGDRVVIDIHPSVHEGRPHHRFNGRVGVVVGTQGKAYLVSIRDGGKEKILISHAIHLRRLK
ncbi:MAG: 50S ribosomal protein L21e [Candidatus Diapherotrites archaeon]|nr:50S ribosomal protein L21e [Candidatus Diapherotrites archaeon]